MNYSIERIDVLVKVFAFIVLWFVGTLGYSQILGEISGCGGQEPYSNNSTWATSYKWSVSGGNIIGSSTNQNVIVDWNTYSLTHLLTLEMGTAISPIEYTLEYALESVNSGQVSSVNACPNSSGTIDLTGYSDGVNVIHWESRDYHPALGYSEWSDPILNTQTSQAFTVADFIPNSKKQYRAYVSTPTTCDNKYSAIGEVTFVSEPSIGCIGLSSQYCQSPQSAYCDSFSDRLYLTNYSHGNIIRWEQSSDEGLTWNPIAVTSQYHDVSTTVSRWYRVVVSNVICGEKESNPIKINIDNLDTGILNGDEIICQGDSDAELTVSNHDGLIEVWQGKHEYGGWYDIEETRGLNVTSFSLEHLNVNTTFKALINNGSCLEQETNELFVTVITPPQSGQLSIDQTNSCGPEEINLTLSNADSGTTTWYQTINNGLSWEIIGHNFSNGSLSIPSVSQTTSYKVVVNGEILILENPCPDAESNIVTIEVHDIPIVDAGDDITAFVNTIVPLDGASPSGGSWVGEGVNMLLNTFNSGIAGVYPLSYQYADDCLNSDTKIVNLLGIPTIEFSGNSNLLVGGEVTIATQGDFNNYQWYSDGVAILGENVETLNVSTPGTYSVKVTTESGYDTDTEPIFIDYLLASSDKNYVMTWSPKKEIKHEVDLLPYIHVTDKQVSYSDGLGRVMQTINSGASPGGSDIVQLIAYDQYGRQSIQYLPYVSNDSEGLYQPTALEILDDDDEPTYTGSPHQLFYADLSSKVATDTRPFSETIFEPSPLNRPSQQYGPGQAWRDEVNSDNDRPVRYRYEVNATDEVLLWTISGDYPITTTNYTAGELYKNITIDEEKHQVIEFVDKLGRTILKRVQAVDSPSATPTASDWADTYYVYDDFGNLRFVLPPEAVNNLSQYDN